MLSCPGVRAVLLICLFAAVLPAQQDRIAAPINGRQSVVVRGSVPPLAQPKYDRGPVDPEFRLGNITLMLRPSADRQAALEQLLAEQQDPSSPNYHNWLTPESYADQFGTSAADLGKIADWLRSQGFVVQYTARGRDFISFSGTASQVQAALHTEIHRYQVGAATHFANSTDLSLPVAIEPMVAGVLGLHDFHPRAPRKKALPVPDFTDLDGSHYLLPDDVATIYDLTPLYSYGYGGAGQSIAIIGQSDIDPTDIASFRSSFGLTPITIQMAPNGNYPGFTEDEVEADLDLEWAGAVARYATLIYVYSDDAGYSSFYAIDNNLAPIISESFGLCESQVVSLMPKGISDFEMEAQKGNALGITWLAASGDSGAAGCDYDAIIATQGLAVSLPASIPEVTAVGGTEFNEGSTVYWSSTNGPSGGSALSYIPEMAWNDTFVSEAIGGTISASGGGVSTLYKKPSWQTGPGVPNDGARDVPDVSLAASDAHDPYFVISEGEAFAVGGTSAATPSFAGMIAVLNQYLVQNGVQTKSGVGNINTKLYSMAAGKAGLFHDVTTGNNIVPCQEDTPNCTNGSFGYTAGVGYDLVTGLGSVDGYNLITALGGIPIVATTTTLTANQATILPSGSTVLTATVKAASGTTSPTGSVSFTLGNNSLGGAALSGSGGTATASISIFGGKLPAPTNAVQAYYPGSLTFTSSSGTATLSLGTPTATSNVVPSVMPNPVYQQAPDANGDRFFFTIQLKETAGIATTLTGLSFNGVSYAASIVNFFGTATLPAHGTISATMKAQNMAVPTSVAMGFTGVDASGATWTQQIAVPFLPPAGTGGSTPSVATGQVRIHR
jgi:subtilase family serine protease